MEFKRIYVIGFLLIILLLFVLAINIDLMNFFDTKTVENYQGFSESQIANMVPCQAGSSNRCMYVRYFDYAGNLQSGTFSNIPNNYYLDSNNILQPVPYGNVKRPDGKGYTPISSVAAFSSAANSSDNVITNPLKCDPRQNILFYPNTKTICGRNIRYTTKNENNALISQVGDIIIPDGYFINAGVVKIVPYGYKATENKKDIIMNDDYAAELSSTKYDTNNYNVTYHSDASNGYDDESTAGNGKMWILDKSGNLISVPYSDVSGSTLYNEPGSFRFGSSNYVPNYEESVYLSKLTNVSTVAPVVNSSANGSGFCSSLYPNLNAIEEKCNSLDSNACASTSCCVLLGGQKCVYGSNLGPHFKSNYSNFMVKNPEFYYYQGKCYGNCQGNQDTTVY